MTADRTTPTGRLYAVPAAIGSLGVVWMAMVDNARESLAAVARGELRASTRQQARWRAIVANDELVRGQS